MSESAIADFVGKFNSETTGGDEPVKGRILLSRKRLVLAANEREKTTIPLSDVFDVAVDHIPPDLGHFFASTVTVAFSRGEKRYVAVVEADDDKIDKFATVLFKALLNGTEAMIKHPARIGGRVTGAEFEPARLALGPQAVRFERADGAVEIRLSTVTGFDRTPREVGDAVQSALEVRHIYGGRATLTVAAIEERRKMAILGRYLRLEYSELMGELEEVELTRDQKELLVALYSGVAGEDVPLANVVDGDPSQVTMLLNRMEEDELVVDGPGGTTLTPKGRVVVNNHLEDVNE
ncbi:MAG: CheF family chemotaxis protein [Salinirussus sp.]